MADKLSESTWTGFLKKQKLELDDGALRKSLAKFDKTDESKPEPRLDALNDLVEQFKKQIVAQAKRKKELGDKPFALVKDQLYELLGEAEALQKKTQAAMAAEDDEDEESAPNALLDSKVLFKQLTMCRRDPERTMKFAFVDAKDKAAAVLVLHPRMGARSLFSKLQAAAGVKTGAYGSAWVDGTSLMLQLDKPLSGLVKKVRAPVKAAGFKIAKAVLWNEDGTVFEQDEEADEKLGTEAPASGTGSAPPNGPAKPAMPGEPKAVSPETAAFTARLKALVALIAAAGDTAAAKQAKLLGSEAGMHSRKNDWARVDALMAQAEALIGAVKASTSAPPATPAGTPTAPATEDAPMARGTVKAPPVNPALAFRSRLMEMVPRMKPVEAAGGPVAAQIKAKREEAVELVRQKGLTAEQLAQALALLDEIDALITASGSTAGSVPKVAAATGGKVVFQQTRLAWDQTRKQVQVELKKLEDSVLSEAKGEPDFAQIAQNSKVLYTVLDHLDERLIDKLDDALSASTPEERTGFSQEAREIVDQYIDYVKSDELLRDIDDNGFVDMQIGSMLTERLTAMAAQLKTAAAA
jgi:hypothetical protein